MPDKNGNTSLGKQKVAQTSPAANKSDGTNLLPQNRPNYRNLSTMIIPLQLQRIRQDMNTRIRALTEAEYAYYPYRVKMQQMFADTVDNAHVFACMDRRKDLTLLRKFEFLNLGGTIDKKTMSYFTTEVKGRTQSIGWFSDFISYALDAIGYGYTLIGLGDVVEDKFPNINTIRRWNISPDRKQVTTFPYQPNGFKFEEDLFRNWHVFVPTKNELGNSDCGYGVYWKCALYEIFARNLLGYNGDFVEMFSQPYRVGKTDKTDEDERGEFAAALQGMGSNGWALIDNTDTIEFIETALGGTGYKGYDNFEERLNKAISKVILGHADAMDSTPGKLGSDKGEESPAQQALEDKQTKDGVFIENVVNDVLLPRMRDIGFLIPDDVRLVFKNDAEVMQYADKLAVIATKMLAGGLQMDPAFWNQETGYKAIPLQAAPAPSEPTEPDAVVPQVKAKLKALYADKHVHRHAAKAH